MLHFRVCILFVVLLNYVALHWEVFPLLYFTLIDMGVDKIFTQYSASSLNPRTSLQLEGLACIPHIKQTGMVHQSETTSEEQRNKKERKKERNLVFMLLTHHKAKLHITMRESDHTSINNLLTAYLSMLEEGSLRTESYTVKIVEPFEANLWFWTI